MIFDFKGEPCQELGPFGLTVDEESVRSEVNLFPLVSYNLNGVGGSLQERSPVFEG